MVRNCPGRSHYSISSVGTDMAKITEMFLTFNLDKPIDCVTEEFGVTVEPQGPRNINYHRHASSGTKFTPSKFALMLIYIDQNQVSKRFELI